MLTTLDTASLDTATFAQLGISAMAYIKAIKSGPDTTYAVHAADGSLICESLDLAEIYDALRQHDITPVSLH